MQYSKVRNGDETTMEKKSERMLRFMPAGCKEKASTLKIRPADLKFSHITQIYQNVDLDTLEIFFFVLRSASKSDPEGRSYHLGVRSGSDLIFFEKSPCKPAKPEQIQNYAQKINKPLHPREYLQIYNANLQIRGPLGQI